MWNIITKKKYRIKLTVAKTETIPIMHFVCHILLQTLWKNVISEKRKNKIPESFPRDRSFFDVSQRIAIELSQLAYNFTRRSPQIVPILAALYFYRFFFITSCFISLFLSFFKTSLQLCDFFQNSIVLYEHFTPD